MRERPNVAEPFPFSADLAHTARLEYGERARYAESHGAAMSGFDERGCRSIHDHWAGPTARWSRMHHDSSTNS